MSSVRPEAIRPVLIHSRTYEVTVVWVFSDTEAVVIFSLLGLGGISLALLMVLHLV